MDFSKNYFENVYDLVKKVPKGKVVTYGEIARAIGNPRMSRQVGWALHVNPKPGVIPCHRVVNRFGELSSAFAFGGVNRQAELLREDGVEVIDNKVDLNKYGYSFKL
ncbi:MAG TPA: MGMT family protein [Candidatus Caccovivens faecavium]|nr:MGMT family protein [Candidatus Caccovivens faecavium]